MINVRISMRWKGILFNWSQWFREKDKGFQEIFPFITSKNQRIKQFFIQKMIYATLFNHLWFILCILIFWIHYLMIFDDFVDFLW